METRHADRLLYGDRPEGASQDVVGWERDGVGGIRLVGFELGQIRAIDEAEFAKLIDD